MSKLETPMIRKYWEKVGGTLIEEFPVVKQSKDNGHRYIDAIIILHEEHTDKLKPSDVSLEGKDVICVQAKAKRLNMYLMGQALFSRHLLEPYKPRSIRSVALCTKDDTVLRPLLERYEGLDVEVINPD